MIGWDENETNDNQSKFNDLRQYNSEHMDILCRKRFYPCEYIDDDSQLDELGPPQEELSIQDYPQKE